MILGIDPGISTGWCLLDDRNQLVSCGNNDRFPFALMATGCRVLIERPQVYRAGKSKGDPNDLITLAVRVGRYWERCEARGFAVGAVLPTTWKGQIPKGPHHLQIVGALTATEREIARTCLAGVSEKHREDVYDAIGLAKWGAVNNWHA